MSKLDFYKYFTLRDMVTLFRPTKLPLKYQLTHIPVRSTAGLGTQKLSGLELQNLGSYVDKGGESQPLPYPN